MLLKNSRKILKSPSTDIWSTLLGQATYAQELSRHSCNSYSRGLFKWNLETEVVPSLGLRQLTKPKIYWLELSYIPARTKTLKTKIQGCSGPRTCNKTSKLYCYTKPKVILCFHFSRIACDSQQCRYLPVFLYEIKEQLLINGVPCWTGWSNDCWGGDKKSKMDWQKPVFWLNISPHY